MKPRYRAEWVVVREELLILASCLLRPMSRNSVLEEFRLRVRRFAVRKRFGLEHREGDLCWSLSESEGRKEKAECHLRRGDGLGNKRK